jgi:hypothetical protein
MGLEQYPTPNRKDDSFSPESLKPGLEAAEQVLNEIRHCGDFDEYTDITSMYRELPSETLVVRRENPEQLMQVLSTGEPLQIQFVGNLPYANSVVWNPRADGTRGIDNAFLEGYGHKDGIVTVYGFEKPDDFYLEQHPESTHIFGGIERSRVRSGAGFVPKEAIRFVTVRIPIRNFPEEHMTETEKDLLWEWEQAGKKSPAFIYRGFLSKEKAADLAMAA